MLYLDLAELDTIFEGKWFWSVFRPNLAWLKREDYFGDPAVPIEQAVRDFVSQCTGRIWQGPIRMLTHLRYFGYCFNPVTFYYCFDASGTQVETVVAEITNTPWGQRYAYLLDRIGDTGEGGHHRYQFPKNFHVSPFFPMELAYDWRFGEPSDRLTVHMILSKDAQKQFDATLDMRCSAINSWNLARALVIYPVMTLQVIAGIYYQATMLKLKKIPFFDHPET